MMNDGAGDDEQPRLHPQSISVIAQSISHLPPVADSASEYLAPDVEYRIRQVIQDSCKIMKHSKRSLLTPDDINSALRLRGADPIFGFGPQTNTYVYRRTPAKSARNNTFSAVNQSPARSSRTGEAQSVPPLGGRSPSNDPGTALSNAATRTNLSGQTDSASTDRPEFASTFTLSVANPIPPNPPSFASVQGIPDLFFACDRERNLQDILLEPLPPVALEATVKSHWLAIDSKQPSIPENPVKRSDEDEEASDAAQKSPSNPSKRKLSVRFPSNGRGMRKKKRSQSHDKIEALIKPRIKHVLSRELQFYFDYVRQAIFKNDPKPIEWALNSVSSEHGIVQLMPYFARFVSSTVRNHLHDLPLLFSLMRLVAAIVENKTCKLENYLHQMLPSILSCLVGKRLCNDPSQDHWALRDFSASLLRRICDRFEQDYDTLKPRLTITLGEALDHLDRPLTTHYGAIVGFGTLGRLTVDKLLLPRLPDFAEKVKVVLDAPSRSAVRRFEAAKVYYALAWAVSMKDKDPSPPVSKSNMANGISKANGGDKKYEKPSIRPELIADVVPDAPRLLPALEKEYGERLFPLGERAFDLDVANDILKLATNNDTP